MTAVRGLTFINAAEGDGRVGALRVVGSRIVAVDTGPETDDVVVDLRGDRLLPGLINAHEHLQLNTLPCLDAERRYRHAREWISDVNRLRRTDRSFEARVAVPRDERLLIGGVKNLLSGVTTVAHHDPLYPFLSSELFPTRVIMDCGWSHSLYVDGPEEVRDSYRRTPVDWPWIVHAAEGVDEEAACEFEKLESLGCVRSNTLIVHGVALDRAMRIRLESAGAALVWCPSSNLRLFGKTAEVAELVKSGRVALGTDSRLSGARDLLTEVRVARESVGFDEATLESLVTGRSAELLRLPDVGGLKAGGRADIVVLPAGMPLSRATRADIRLVLVGGTARYGDNDYARSVAPAADWSEVRIDGREKLLAASLTVALYAAAASEPGLELSNLTWRAA